ncbi:MAG: histidine kinase N-terminal 7TM domain-containing protein [Clostridiaceae bacterium]|nr:histidine kinase N-terminal 7TM domain-containing protein [Clostridiaceae bacterium]
MPLSNLSFSLVILSMVFIAFIFFVVARMRSKNQIHYVFMILMTTLFIWAVGSVILDYDSLMGLETKHWAVNLAYVGLILTPVAILFMGLVFAKTKIKFSWKHCLFLIVPMISLIMLFTNDQHHLFYRYIKYEDLTQAKALGSYFIYHTIYSYICIAAGMGQLIYFSVKNAGFFSRQSFFIALGIVISFGYNFLLTAQVIDGYFHTNVIAFFFTFLLFYFAIIKYDFLGIVPVALQNIVDHISDSFLVIDKEHMIIDYNKTFINTFGSLLKINRKASLEQYCSDPTLGKEITELMTALRDAVTKHESTSFEKSIVINNEEKYFTIEITTLYSQNIYLSTIILLKDITQVKNALETIQKNYEMLMEKEQLASLGQMIGGIAHNLKTPIMSISGGIEGLKDLIDEYKDSIGDESVTDDDHREIAGEMEEWIKKIKPYCSYMSDIISTVKGQAAQFSSSSDMTFTLDELTKRVDLLMKHELNRFHCRLQIIYETDPALGIKGDVNSLVQIFDNLIINAVHSYAGKTGEIILIIRKIDTQIVFSLQDFGKGIPAIIQEKLFKEMVTTKGKDGTGLGLYMSYATVKGKFSGNMWFKSEEDKGTTFFISIPIA